MAFDQNEVAQIARALLAMCQTCRNRLGLSGVPTTSPSDTCYFCDSANFPAASLPTTALPPRVVPTKPW